MSEPARVICIPANGPPPDVASIKSHCLICAQEVWVSFETTTTTMPLDFVCILCAPGTMRVDGTKVIDVLPETRAELHALGFTDEMIAAALADAMEHLGLEP